ncbi:uncharacterized protein BX663DRAFT_432348 [Cokeromyces recurvatus]|uniref:uncharacterized protein n=1 Tax=Cokeromyces recurvatus TaxID=90255 RepID=UPI002220E1E4|nr:uncharacterized protein BX663DRAFT_432348 [Cokeromyces recurvatus]KAI7904052.1 hypothetical protein BX663DRAFT_432348 [Cokeromyces recurvatus]
MTDVSRNDALCIFYNEEITDEAAKKPAVRLDSFCGLDICYTEDPKKPMLQTKVKIHGDPAYYHLYNDHHQKAEISADMVILSK